MSEQVTIPVPAISDAEATFPVDVLKWLPPMEEIPEEFRRHGSTEWNEIVSAWFFRGLPADVEFYARDGVDAEAAVRAIKATLGSFAPKHEHKEAAAAYLLSQWFLKIKNWKAK